MGVWHSAEQNDWVSFCERLVDAAYQKNEALIQSNIENLMKHGRVAKLVDALDLGSSGLPPWEFDSLHAHHLKKTCQQWWVFFLWAASSRLYFVLVEQNTNIIELLLHKKQSFSTLTLQFTMFFATSAFPRFCSGSLRKIHLHAHHLKKTYQQWWVFFCGQLRVDCILFLLNKIRVFFCPFWEFWKF